MENFEIVKRSQIYGEFKGFDEEMLFKFIDGTFWIQDEYKYWYHYSYFPEALILKKDNRLYIKVEGQDETVPIRQIFNVIESRINGEFKGWVGETEYELVNGQVWKQSKYKNEYKYAYMPEVIIYEALSGMVMLVKGTTANVKRIR